MKIHFAYRCAVTKHQCTAAMFTVNCLPCSAVPNQLTAAFCIYTYEDPLCIQVCSHQTPVHCCNVYGKLPALFCCAAVPNQLTAAFCIYTYEDPLCKQVCSHQTPVHCCNVYGKLPALFCCAKPTDSSLLHLHLRRPSLQTGVQPPNTSALLQCLG